MFNYFNILHLYKKFFLDYLKKDFLLYKLMMITTISSFTYRILWRKYKLKLSQTLIMTFISSNFANRYYY